MRRRQMVISTVAVVSLWIAAGSGRRPRAGEPLAPPNANAAQDAQRRAEAEKVRKAVALGVAYLKKRQDKETGTWDDSTSVPDGPTALCALALLESGVPAGDASLRNTLDYLRKRPPDRTYSVALETMVFCRAEPKKDRALIRRNVTWLEEHQLKEGPRAGAWNYGMSRGGGSGDNSNSHFAMLALNDAAAAGATVKKETWQRALDYWAGCQNQDGSWGYYGGVPGTGSMTCAGIASVAIAAEGLKGDEPAAKKAKRALDAAFAWLGKNFSVERNPGLTRWLLYYLHALKHAGRLTKRKLIARHDWYREGYYKLLRDQDSIDGFWLGVGHADDNPEIATGFALLFLAADKQAQPKGQAKQ